MARLESREAAHRAGCCCAARARSSPTAASVARRRRVRRLAGRGERRPPLHRRTRSRAARSACLVEADGVEAFGVEPSRAIGALRGAEGSRRRDRQPRSTASRRDMLDVVASPAPTARPRAACGSRRRSTALGRRCGVVGTLGNGEPCGAATAIRSRRCARHLTTPDPLHAAARRLRDFVDGRREGVRDGSVVASASPGSRRTAARSTSRCSRIFTQTISTITATWARTAAAKARLFAWPGAARRRSSIVDDAPGVELADDARRQGAHRLLDGLDARPAARLRAERRCATTARRARRSTLRRLGRRRDVASALVGDVQRRQPARVARRAARERRRARRRGARAERRSTPVPGRMQRVAAAGAARRAARVVVDYAHTPDALEKVLAALRAARRGARRRARLRVRLRRRSRRGQAAADGRDRGRLADRVVVTSDNPRSEDRPTDHRRRSSAGAIGHDEVDVIETAPRRSPARSRSARGDDVVLIAGKGHEDYQDIARREAAVLRSRARAPRRSPRGRAAGAEVATMDDDARSREAAALTARRAAVVGDANVAFARVSTRYARGRRRATCSSR